MRHSAAFFKSILDSVTDHIVIIDQNGIIRFVNAAWSNFAIANQCAILNPHEWRGINYLDVCDASVSACDANGRAAAAGTRQVIERRADVFYHEYPCDSQTEKRWFMMRVTPLQWDRDSCFVISHQNITERKLAEEKIQALSLTDELTGMPNRRHFFDFLSTEWRRGARMKSPLSFILLDVDHFKSFNDRHGHLGGDDCLKKIGNLLKCFAKRPGDLCARFGGDEFALILGNTDMESSAQMAHGLLAAIREVNTAQAPSVVVTASLGVATMYPSDDLSEKTLVELADQALYGAKDNGRNIVFFNKEQAPQGYCTK